MRRFSPTKTGLDKTVGVNRNDKLLIKALPILAKYFSAPKFCLPRSIKSNEQKKLKQKIWSLLPGESFNCLNRLCTY